MDKLFVNFLPPWVETNIQPAFYDKESGSVLQQTARMYAKVNCLVRMFNKLSKETKETVDEYIAKFVELKDFVDTYFENLDVQEEINNKLDKMTEDGTLQAIIEAYLQPNVTWTFDTVADMKQSTTLIAGTYARTLGFYSVGDNGGATYRISDTGTANERDVIAVGDVYAILANTDYVTAEMFGAKGDGNTDDADALTAFVANTVTDKRLKAGATYKISSNKLFRLNSGVTLDGNGATIQKTSTSENSKATIFYLDPYGTTAVKKNITIKNLTLDGDSQHGQATTTPLLRFTSGNGGKFKNILISNCRFQNVLGHGIGIYNDNDDVTGTCENITIENCGIYNCAGVGIQQSKVCTTIKNCKIYDTTSEAITIDNGCVNCLVDGCEIHKYGYGGGIGIDECTNARIVNCLIDGTDNTAPVGYRNAITLNASTGINYGTVIANNVLENNATGIFIGSANSIEAYNAIAIGLSITGNVFRGHTDASIMLRRATSSTKITASGNRYDKAFTVSDTISKTILPLILNVDFSILVNECVTASENFAIDKKSIRLYQGMLLYDVVVKSTSTTMPAGWTNVLDFGCSAYNVEEIRIPIYNSALTSLVGYKDAQVYANNFKAYWGANDSIYTLIIKGTLVPNNR